MNYIYTSYKVLDGIFRNKAYSSIELNNALKLVPQEDKGKVTKIVYGVLENSVRYDYYIKALAPKKPKESIVVLLKTGLYLLKEMDGVKTYAAVDEIVKIAKKISHGALTSFVNGFLRKATDFEPPMPTDNLQRLSFEFSVPTFFVEKLLTEYGEEMTERILINEEVDETNYRINQNAYSIEKFFELLQSCEVKYISGKTQNTFMAKKAEADKLPQESCVIQGLASILAVDKMNVKEGDVVFDACASPGGKSVYLAEKVKSGKVVSADIHPHRLSLIQKYADKMGCKNLEIICQNGEEENKDLMGKFDSAICDAPCSGAGVFKRKPDILFDLSQEKIDNLKALQLIILTNTSKYVKKGGTLMYSTCTLFDEENSGVIDKFLENNSEYVEEKIIMDEVPYEEKRHGIQLLPNLSGTVGFYMCKLKKL